MAMIARNRGEVMIFICMVNGLYGAKLLISFVITIFSATFAVMMHTDMFPTLYLVRHGESEGNVRQVLQGQTHGNLTPLGLQQAQAAARQLTDVTVDVFMTSDLQRAVDTCRILAEEHPGAEVHTTPLLRERDWGDFTGQFIPDLQGKPFPDNVETLEHLQERARQFLHDIRIRYVGKTVVAVSHGIMLKAIQAVYYGRKMQEVEKMTNAEVRLLRQDNR